MMSTLKRELQTQQDDLFMSHQQENAVDGGNASTIMFHYLLAPNTITMTATSTYPSTTIPAKFDANSGVTGTADVVFPGILNGKSARRDFRNKGRGF